MNEVIENALSDWMFGMEEIARRVDAFGTATVVGKDERGEYNVFRAFGIGDNAGVSADLQSASSDDAIRFLLGKA